MPLCGTIGEVAMISRNLNSVCKTDAIGSVRGKERERDKQGADDVNFFEQCLFAESFDGKSPQEVHPVSAELTSNVVI